MLPEYYLPCKLHVNTSCRHVPMIPSSQYKDNLLVYGVNTTKNARREALDMNSVSCFIAEIKNLDC